MIGNSKFICRRLPFIWTLRYNTYLQADATIVSGPEICVAVYEICTFTNLYNKTEYERR